MVLRVKTHVLGLTTHLVFSVLSAFMTSFSCHHFDNSGSSVAFYRWGN
jgi:hypothetical protein